MFSYISVCVCNVCLFSICHDVEVNTDYVYCGMHMHAHILGFASVLGKYS